MSNAEQDFVRQIYSKSVMKQAKFEQITGLLGDTEGLTCLDLGGDNGVISLLLRERGGTWSSADLSQETVDSIRGVVGERVHLIDGRKMPFEGDRFDRVVVVDMLEHVHEDRELVRELHRIIRPDGELIVNVPHVKPRSIVNRVRHAIGQTDERHGHVRPGYSTDGLRRTLAPWFEVRETQTYSGTFTELIDTAIRFAVDLKKGHRSGGAGDFHKGNIVTKEDVQVGGGGGSGLLTLTYPVLWVFSRLDRLLLLQKGYKLVVKAVVRQASGTNGDGS